MYEMGQTLIVLCEITSQQWGMLTSAKAAAWGDNEPQVRHRQD